MKFAKFLRKNIKWNLCKDYFSDLCCSATEEDVLIGQMHRLADRYFPELRQVETAYTEFCLNEIALATAKTPAQKFAKKQFGEFWQSFLRLKRVFDKPAAVFPANDGQTRIDAVAKLIAQCTQFAVSQQTLEHLKEEACEIFDFSERERRYFAAAIQLWRINFFCATARGIFKKSKFCAIRLAKMLDECAVDGEYVFNSRLRQANYATERLAANLNCLGASATKLSAPTQTEVKPFFFCNGRNVFDTFCYSKLGNFTAQFYSQSGLLQVEMQYFLQGMGEVRRYTLSNLGKADKKITADFLFRHLNLSNKTKYFPAEGALCLSVEGEQCFYAAAALVCNHKLLPCQFEEGRVSHIFNIPCGQKVNFELVTLFAPGMPELSDSIQSLNRFGATRCPYLCDFPSSNITETNCTLHPTAHGFLPRKTPKKDASTINFTYQLGNEQGATFLDNSGNCTTLLKGFPFGVEGEKVFAVKNNVMRQLNCGVFLTENNCVVFKNTGNVVCKIVHGNEKRYKIEYAAKHRTVFYFPLEETSQITHSGSTFSVKSASRAFEIRCVGKVESFTTNALECNIYRMRYKFSDELQYGGCLAICFAEANKCEVAVCAKEPLPQPAPLLRESLISTYLNYVNNKNVFCLVNFLKRADPLTLAAITFTNPQFVKYFAQNLFENHRFFYDAAGPKKPYFNKLALPLALIYYASLTGEGITDVKLQGLIKQALFEEKFIGRDMCIQALALKKAAAAGLDKIECLVEYNCLKKTICGDSKLYAYAQAIGAVPMLKPSKERLKDLCNQFEIPKSWYYVSQLENLYGLTLCQGTLQFAPRVTQNNLLEPLTLEIFGKRLDATFVKSTVPDLTLNGVTHFLPLRASNLKSDGNKLEVHYQTM